MISNYRNPIVISGLIDNKDFYAVFVKRFSEVISTTKEGDEITVFINSPGGESYTALGIYDLLITSKRTVVGIVSGTAQSGASLILQACNKRIMTKNSNLMLHKSSIQIAGSVQNAEEALKSLKQIDDKYYEIYAKRTGEKISYISEMAHKDKYFNSDEALQACLIDEILDN